MTSGLSVLVCKLGLVALLPDKAAVSTKPEAAGKRPVNSSEPFSCPLLAVPTHSVTLGKSLPCLGLRLLMCKVKGVEDGPQGVFFQWTVCCDVVFMSILLSCTLRKLSLLCNKTCPSVLSTQSNEF